jgi:hypothetical protein
MCETAFLGTGENMKRLLWVTALGLFIAIVTRQSDAVEVSAFDVRINLPAPKGYCPLEKQNPAESQALDAMQQGIKNELLSAFAQCDRLKAWREGKANEIGNTANYQLSLSTKAQRLSAQQVIPSVCAEFRKQGATIVKDAKAEINKRLESVEILAKQLKLNTQKVYGVLHEDKTGCYIGIIQKFEVKGKIETLFTVDAITVVKGKIIYFYLDGDLDGSSAIQRQLATSRSTIEATLAQN